MQIDLEKKKKKDEMPFRRRLALCAEKQPLNKMLFYRFRVNVMSIESMH